ncbi:MAG: sigma-54 dependent transcriptional regulator [candidate division KSB1 bacterium]|nr:sigma-54 dependent transcriptional regulator [candidate division KSB1 bacterium]MDZ7305113.1 sigma-54 dependent transcriptional regulator [candidate division KSB1 bacterium]MDZ7314186.1 sigma-54 dependent transcriptional regulator [candidate division KSB1 bacterium]
MAQLLFFKSQTMQQLVQQIESIAASNVAIFIHGETGAGKNVMAEHVHRRSGRNGIFLPLDCAALSRSLLESELFGHEKGAFTGAIEQKNGYLDLVRDGTLFLDEVENLDEEIQIKLLNVLDTRHFRRVGGRELVTTEFRLISATNVDIQQRIESNKFRQDFYYRIKGYTLTIPPLREHREDIPLLAEYFLQEFCTRYKKDLRCSQEALFSLTNYDWPGNIRELKMIMESVVVTTEGHRIESAHLPLEVQQRALLKTAEDRQWTADKLLDVYVQRILALTSNNKTRAAKMLGWSPNKLKRHMQRMNQ